MDIPGIDLPKELLAALDASKKLPGSIVTELLTRAIDKLALMYGEASERQRKDQAFVKSAVVEITTLVPGEDIPRDHVEKFVLDPSEFFLNQHQRHKKHVNHDGTVRELEKVGDPSLIVVGKIMNRVVHIEEPEE